MQYGYKLKHSRCWVWVVVGNIVNLNFGETNTLKPVLESGSAGNQLWGMYTGRRTGGAIIGYEARDARRANARPPTILQDTAEGYPVVPRRGGHGRPI
jgi:hypothetical protein